MNVSTHNHASVTESNNNQLNNVHVLVNFPEFSDKKNKNNNNKKYRNTHTHKSFWVTFSSPLFLLFVSLLIILSLLKGAFQKCSFWYCDSKKKFIHISDRYTVEYGTLTVKENIYLCFVLVIISSMFCFRWIFSGISF